MSETVKLTTPKEMLEFRNKLLEKYGGKIIHGSTEHMTPKEKEACATYRLLTNNLHHLAPHTVITDKLTLLYSIIGRLFHKDKIIVFHDL